MSDYVCILPLGTALDREGVRKLARHSCLGIHRVQWVRACIAADGSRLLGWYQAADAEAVRFVLRQQGEPSADLWLADVTGNRAPSGDADAPCVAVEFQSAPGGGEVAALAGSAAAALARAGLQVARRLLERNGERAILIVTCDDVTAVTRCLRAAGLEPSAAWPGFDIDPGTAGLFPDAPVAQVPGAVDEPSPRAGKAAEADYDAVIAGAGIGGICMLHRLLSMGLRVRVFESAGDVGGVWHWNRYPGARVDSETYTYLFTFSDALRREWRWSELFAAQPEIESYLRHVVERFDLRRHIRFHSPVTTARFHEGRACWEVQTGSGERVTARYFIAATGSLTAPQMPDFPGMDEFGGVSCHTSRWPASGIGLDGRRVAVIGTGASGIQVVQTIAPRVADLVVFQRTPTYCVPQRNRPLDDTDHRRIDRDWDDILAACRRSPGALIHDFDPRSGLAVSDEEREAVFEKLWQTPGFAFWFGNFADVLMNAEVNEHACEFIRRKINERVHDPEVARRLLPSHPFGAKRVPLENGYYETFNRDNVRLVDLRETPIERITASGIRTTREEFPLDVIVYATGFDAGTGALTRMDIRGVDGRSIADRWRQGSQTFLGLLVSGFPNLFLVNGPQNAAALCNGGRCIEQNVDWIARCIEHMRLRGRVRIHASPDAEARWTAHVDDLADGTVLGHMTDSWFFGANTPGKARKATVYAAGAREFRRHCENVARAGYVGCTLS